ncbi:MAG: YraN family protein [Caulobacteraceae bacterium]
MRGIRQARGSRARASGRRAEVWCALWLMAKGYRILGFRLRTPQGEVDILALKAGVVVVVEIKRRTTLAAAIEAVSRRQRETLLRVAHGFAATRRGLPDATVRLDLIALAPGRAPRHIRDAWRLD